MAGKSTPQKMPSQQANVKWFAIPSLIVFVLNALIWTFYFVGPRFEDAVYQQPGTAPSMSWVQDVMITGVLLCLPLLLLTYFLIGVLRGLATGKELPGIAISCLACLLSLFAAYLLPTFVYGALIHELADSRGFPLLLIWGVAWFALQMVVAALVAGGGGLIGSHLLHQCPQPGNTTEQ
jgi:hypothetical protein